MTCEEFAMAGLDLGSETEDSPLQQAAREHLRNCPDCAALHEQWQTLRADLRLLGRETSEAAAPARVEMRLRQDFHTKHKTMRARRAAVTVTWALAAAAVLVAAGSWIHWRQEQNQAANLHNSHPAQVTGAQVATPEQPGTSTAGADLGETIVTSNDSSDFTLLPGSMPSATEDAMVVRVGMQRAALGGLGLTVNEEHAGDWIQVDLLIGDDGLPQAVRLPQTTN
jgi:predicted anti-sigma-YlaC factor YlaD